MSVLCFYYDQFICLRVSFSVLGVFPLCYCLVVSRPTSAVDCLKRLVSEMTSYVSSGTLKPAHSLTHLDITFVVNEEIFRFEVAVENL